MYRKALIAFVAIGLLVGMTGQVGAVASPSEPITEDYAVTDVPTDLSHGAEYFGVGVMGHECFSEDGREHGSCEHV